MAKFIFKMQNILNLKYKLEEQAKIEFSLAAGRLAEEEKKLAELKNRRFYYELKLKEAMKDVLDIRNIKSLEEAVEVMKFRIKVQTVAVNDAKLHLEKARRNLNRAMSDRKTYEKLRENAFEEFKKEINDQEKKEIDELVSYKYGAGTA